MFLFFYMHMQKTRDLTLCATLSSLGVQIDQMEKDSDGRCFFHFSSDDRVASLIEHFWAGDLRIDPRVFHQNLKLLKNRIYEEKRTNPICYEG